MHPPEAIETVCNRMVQYADLIAGTAAQYGIDPWLVAGVAAHESQGNPYAVRVERGWLARYRAGSIAAAAATPSRLDDAWLSYEDYAQSSFGLMQVMYVVAIERGIVLRYPTELCHPPINIDAGCRQLAHLRRKTDDSSRPWLLRYNGGGNILYPDAVGQWARRLQNFDGFPRLDAIRAP